METLSIDKTAQDIFTVLLPPCDTSILVKVLDPTIPFISLIGYWTEDIRTWIEHHLPPLFDKSERAESVRLSRLEMDVSLRTGDFLRHLPSFSKRGLNLIQAIRPLPEKLFITEIKPESKARIFRQVGITLQFYLPHPHEYALVTSPSIEVLEKIIASFSK